MSRLYLALDVDFDDDDKVSRLARYTRPGEARACRDLLVAAWRYCKRERSDGHVPHEIIGKLAYPDSPRIGRRDADRLVEVGLAEVSPSGYYFPGYLKRNKSRAQLEAEALQKAEAGRKGGQVSGSVRSREAQAKQGASTVRSHRHTTETETTTEPIQLGGDRPEPLRSVAATKPLLPEDHRCTDHQGVADPGPCRGCGAAREKAQRKLTAELEREARAAEKAARDCDRCDGVRELDAAGQITNRKCNHRGRRAS